MQTWRVVCMFLVEGAFVFDARPRLHSFGNDTLVSRPLSQHRTA